MSGRKNNPNKMRPQLFILPDDVAVSFPLSEAKVRYVDGYVWVSAGRVEFCFKDELKEFWHNLLDAVEPVEIRGTVDADKLTSKKK